MDAYVGFGSNLGDREASLRGALADLARRGLPPGPVSSVWETEPVDAPPGTGWFLNLVARIRTDLPPVELLDLLLEIERDRGRVRGGRNAPRTLDLDLLLAGDHRCEGARLTLPHPRMWERRFVLAPLAEIAPDLRDGATGRTVTEILRTLPSTPIVRKVGILDRTGSSPGL